MRVPAPSPRSRRLAWPALVLLGLAAIASGGAADDAAPSLAAFDRFELADVQLDARLPAPGRAEPVRRALQMHLHDRLDPWIAERHRRAARSTPPRTLRIEAVIVALDPIDPAARLATGATAGGAQLRVRVHFVDAATGVLAAATELRAGNPVPVDVAAIDAAGAQPRRIAADLAGFLDAAVTSTPTPEPRLPR
jgi:hypothetical protein